MRNRRRMTNQFVVFAALAILLSVSGIAGCGNGNSSVSKSVPPQAGRLTTAPPLQTLGAVEIRSYQGAKLDAVSSEPENSISGPQHIDIKTYRLAVTGLVKTPLSLTYDAVTAMPAYQKVTTLHCIEGWSRTYKWRGVLLKDLLARAGYDPSAKILIFRCADGYTTSLPVDFIVNHKILLAYRMNDIVMPPERGFPFQVVAENHYGYKWAKWVTSIEVSNNTNFRGYWESRGYDNAATLPGAK